jgi:hypothetical protein
MRTSLDGPLTSSSPCSVNANPPTQSFATDPVGTDIPDDDVQMGSASAAADAAANGDSIAAEAQSDDLSGVAPPSAS